MRRLLTTIIATITLLNLHAQINGCWEEMSYRGEAVGRHESSFVEFEGRFYFLGGRGVMSVDVYDPTTNSWETRGKTPLEINHFQAVVYEDAIYSVCAMNGKYPIEEPLENVWIYHPSEDRWEEGDKIPAEYQRGGSGAVVYNGKIYIACGIDFGHTSGTNNLFSSYDPRTGEWETLTKAPHIRDHFAAIVHNDKLYCIGGRNSSLHYPGNAQAFFGAVVSEVDIYDFESERWVTSREPLPVPTAAGGVVSYGEYIIYMGGESSQDLAHSETQCLDTESGEWSQLSPMTLGLHGSGAILYNDAIYWMGGSYKRGGSNTSHLLRLPIAQ